MLSFNHRRARRPKNTNSKHITTMETKNDKLQRLQEILCELEELGYEASELVHDISKSHHTRGESYGAFDLGTSTNHYDTTLRSIVESLEEEDFDDETNEEDE